MLDKKPPAAGGGCRGKQRIILPIGVRGVGQGAIQYNWLMIN
jgi:hypothetical protein